VRSHSKLAAYVLVLALILIGWKLLADDHEL
jgi:hypothetical protein